MYDPNEEFVVVSIFRSQIAQMFNEIIADNSPQYTLPLFSGNDPRLTYDVCREVTEVFAEAQECDSVEDRGAEEREGVFNVFIKYFPG